ncbi:uncharacterized protein LOC108831606 [Raphanus sativus]|uniref:Uncharacterized protein LOC108831606 n=1 Tax=Raphanus sativus TaxID=3726 RepID=A0A6J0LKU7_RAPSA|nr:uncharacterized protein LOC108831606 [Raphanus sativus]
MTITSSLKAIEETVMKAVSESYNKMISIVLGGQQNTFVVPGGVQNSESHHPAPSKPTNNIGGADHAYTTDGAADAVRKVIADLDEVTAAAEGLGIEPITELHHNESASQGDIDQSTSSVDPLINITEHRDVEESDSEELPSSDNLVPSAVECPSFSIGLTQDGTSDNVVHAQPIEFVLPQELEAAIPAETRKSKRPKTAPAAYTDFKCDPKIVVQYSLLPELDTLFADVEKRVMAMETVNLSEHISVSATEFLDIAFRRQHMPTKVMDALMGYLSSQLKSGDNKAKLMRMHSRFVKTSVKERAKLKLFDEVFSTPTASTAEKIYFPFNIDQTHWVAVCVDRKNSSIHVLDCNVLLKTDSMMKKELNPIANMFPYVGNKSPSDSSNATYKPFSVSMSKGIPQYATPNDSAVMAVLLIDSHSSAGLDGCKAVTQRLLPGAAKQLAVKFFDFISGTD